MDDDWLPPLPDPDRLPRVLTRYQARARGMTPTMIQRRLDAGRWRLILPSIYLTTDTMTWHDRRCAALAFAGPGAVLSGAAALCDRGLRSVSRPARILVLVPPRTRVRSVGWVQIRPTRRLPRPALEPGLPTAPVARAVADLALRLRRLDDVRTLVAEVTRLELCTLDDLGVELEAAARNGSRNLRDALADVGAGAWSAPEARAARLLRASGVADFEQNVRINLPNGNWVVVDFLWRALRAVLEIDSDRHHGSPRDRDATDERHIDLHTIGFNVIHRRPAFIERHPRRFTDGVAAWLASLAVAL